MIKKPLVLLAERLGERNQDVPIRLGSDLVDDGAENTSVAVVELGVVGVRGVKVIGGVLSL